MAFGGPWILMGVQGLGLRFRVSFLGYDRLRSKKDVGTA